MGFLILGILGVVLAVVIAQIILRGAEHLLPEGAIEVLRNLRGIFLEGIRLLIFYVAPIYIGWKIGSWIGDDQIFISAICAFLGFLFVVGLHAKK
jgi:hypothetical protein